MKNVVSYGVMAALSDEFICHGKIGVVPSPKTKKNRKVFFNDLLRFLNGKSFDVNIATEFITNKEKAGAKLNSVRTDIKNVCALANWLVRKGLLKEGFSHDIEQPKSPKQHRTFHSPLIYEKIIYAGVECSEFDNKQHKIQKIEALNALLFILSTGCRISEVLNLRGEDISASEEKVEVILHRKGGGTDQKEITDSRVKQALIQRIKRQKVFSVTQELLRKVLKRGAKKLGITGGEMNVHSLRHAFATDLLRNGCSLPQVSRALGHANTRITYETYAHLDSADVAHAIRTFGSLSKRDATPAELRKLLLDALNREGFTSSNWLELKKTESGKLELIL